MKIRLLLSFMTLSLLACTQPKMKIYGYVQHFTPGNIPVNDEGEPMKYPTVNYFIYITSDSVDKVKASEIWIAGQWFKVTGQNAVTTPVTVTYPAEKTLVAATNKKTVQLNIDVAQNPAIASSVKLEKLMKSNELIIGYWWNGKKCYATLKKLIQLAPFEGI